MVNTPTLKLRHAKPNSLCTSQSTFIQTLFSVSAKEERQMCVCVTAVSANKYTL